MNAPSPRVALHADALTVSYAPPAPLHARPQPARQVAGGLLHKHLLLSGDAAAGLIAVGPGDARQSELTNDVLLAAVPVVGRITNLRKQGEPFASNRYTGMHWRVEFALDGTPHSAEIFILALDAALPGSVLTIACWGDATQAAAAGAIVDTMTATRGMNPARKSGLLRIGIGAGVLLLGLLVSAIGYAAADSRRGYSGSAQEYTVFVGLLGVGVFLIAQGLWKLLSGRS